VARKQRIHYEGAMYHIMVRGNNGEYILKDMQDKMHYLDIIVDLQIILSWNKGKFAN